MAEIQPPAEPGQPEVIIHVIRHAQAESNVKSHPEPWKIPNPRMTPHGVKQFQHVLSTFLHMSTVTHVLCSPLKRTIDTALLSFQPIFDRGIKAVLVGELREWGDGPVNKGSPIEELLDELVDRSVEFGGLHLRWELQKYKGNRALRVKLVKSGLYEFVRRIRTGGDWDGIPLKQVAGRIEILIVSHGGFLSSLVGEDGKHIFYNLQFRSYRLLMLTRSAPDWRNTISWRRRARHGNMSHSRQLDRW